MLTKRETRTSKCERSRKKSRKTCSTLPNDMFRRYSPFIKEAELDRAQAHLVLCCNYSFGPDLGFSLDCLSSSTLTRFWKTNCGDIKVCGLHDHYSLTSIKLEMMLTLFLKINYHVNKNCFFWVIYKAKLSPANYLVSWLVNY